MKTLKTDPETGTFVSYIIILIIFFLVLCTFMEFPSLHRGRTYIERDGRLIEINKPFFHAPFNFKGQHIPDPEKDERMVKTGL